METKRNKGWRRFQQDRVFKARMLMFSGYDYAIFDEEGNRIDNPHWFEIARQRWAKKYKDSSTPCSCWLCRGEKYDRKAHKRTTRRIIDECLE